jgi:type II secretory pathway pseudopilin PulG
MKQRGFTYLWTLLLVVLIGVGLAAQAEIISTAERREREQMLLFIGNEFRRAIGSYYQQTPGQAKQFPPSLDALLRDERFPDLRRHLRRIYPDPMTGKAEWGLVIVGERIVGVHSLSDARPIKTGNFEPGDAALANAESYAKWIFSYVPPPPPPAAPQRPPNRSAG